MRHVTRLTVTLLAVLLIAGCSLWPGHRVTAKRTQTTMHVAGSGLDVTARNGSIAVLVDSRATEVTIDATITCAGDTAEEAQQRLDAATLHVARDTRGTLDIHVVFPGEGPRPGEGVSFAVRLPNADGVVLKTSNGPVDVTGTSGDLDIDTSNGAVTVSQHVGPVHADTSNGPVTIQGLTSAARVSTSNSPITVLAHPDAAMPVELHTSNGPIALVLGAAFTGRIDCNTSNAGVVLEDPHGRATENALGKRSGHVIIGADEETSTLRTSNGQITVTVGG